MAFQFPKDPYDGQSAEIKQPNGTEFIYTYNKAQNTWELAGQGIDLDQNNIVIYTDNVLARGNRPAASERNTNYKNNRNDSTFEALNNQQDINWVLHDAIGLVEGASKVWVDNVAPPDETYQFWWHTDTLELLFYYNDQWWPVSIPPAQVNVLKEVIEGLEVSVTQVRGDIAKNKIDIDELRQDIIDGEFRPNLEQVLTQGNLADHDIILTDGVSDVIDVSPSEGRITIASNTDFKPPRITMAHYAPVSDGDKKVEIELDENGTRLDFEMFEAVESVHFRFDGNEKFTINAEGDSEFTGKVRATPGSEGNELVTYGQLSSVEEELEQLAPSLERGSWTFTLNYPPGPGEYTMISAFLSEEDQQALCDETYAQCVLDAAGDAQKLSDCNRELGACKAAVDGSRVVTTDDWTKCDELVFNDVDMNGLNHGWAGIDSDHYIDVFNMNDENFMVGDIGTHDGGKFSFDLISSRGVAVGPATVKIFKAEGAVDFNQYVRKQGDTMSGKLVIERPRTSNNDNSFIIRGRVDGAESVLLKDYQRESDSSRSDFIEYFGESTSPNSLVNVQYVKDYIEDKIPGSDIADPPKYFKWSIDNNADVSPGYFTGPPSRNNDEPRLNAQSTVWISMPDQFGKAFQSSTNPRTFGWGTTITVSEKLNSNTSRLSWSAQVKSIRMAANTQVWEVTFTNLVLINWMSTSSLYRVEIGGFN